MIGCPQGRLAPRTQDDPEYHETKGIIEREKLVDRETRIESLIGFLKLDSEGSGRPGFRTGSAL